MLTRREIVLYVLRLEYRQARDEVRVGLEVLSCVRLVMCTLCLDKHRLCYEKYHTDLEY